MKLISAKKNITSLERSIAFLIFIFVGILFCHFQLVIALGHHLDSTFLMENIISIKKIGIPTSYLTTSFLDALSTFTLNADKLCQSELIPTLIPQNILNIHAYFILYPLALLTPFFSPHAILAVVNGLCFVSFIFILYWSLRKTGVAIFGAIMFCLLVVAHPAWSHASIGDFYVDRFFMPLGLLYMFLLYDSMVQKSKISRNYLLTILAIGLLAASTTERGAIMIAFFTIACTFFYAKRMSYQKIVIGILIIFSMMLLLYVFLYLKVLYVYHDGIGSLGQLLKDIPFFFEQIKAPIYAAKLHEFIVINVLLLGVFSFFNWRLALIAFIALLPNMLTTIGGAEKTGWATHYHSMYFPFLVFASAIGFSNLWLYLNKTIYRWVLTGVLLALITIISHSSIDYRNVNGVVARLYYYYKNVSQSIEKRQAWELEQITAAVPLGAKVTALEIFMPTLYLQREVYYYPIGIDVADYAVVTRVSQENGEFYYSGAISYLPGETQKIDICLTDRLKKAGYNVEQPRLLLGHFAVLERKIK